MPVFSILFFILCLGNSGTPLTVNFIGEFMCLYGTFEQLPILGALASSSIVFSAAYTIYMFNRITFGGSYSRFFMVNIPDINKREFFILLILVVFTVVLGLYPAPILDGLHYSVSALVYNTDTSYNAVLMAIPIMTINSKKIRYQNLNFNINAFDVAYTRILMDIYNIYTKFISFMKAIFNTTMLKKIAVKVVLVRISIISSLIVLSLNENIGVSSSIYDLSLVIKENFSFIVISAIFLHLFIVNKINSPFRTILILCNLAIVVFIVMHPLNISICNEDLFLINHYIVLSRFISNYTLLSEFNIDWELSNIDNENMSSQNNNPSPNPDEGGLLPIDPSQEDDIKQEEEDWGYNVVRDPSEVSTVHSSV
jgi:hypothetical protein